MPRKREATWASWDAPKGEFHQNPPVPGVLLYRSDRNGFVWQRRVKAQDWITLSEAANLLGINPATAWLWSREGKLRTKKRKKVRVVKFAEVHAIVVERGITKPRTKGIFLTG